MIYGNKRKYGKSQRKAHLQAIIAIVYLWYFLRMKAEIWKHLNSTSYI